MPICFPYFTLGQFGVVNDPGLTIDQTNLVQLAIDTAKGHGPICMEPWKVGVTQLRLYQGSAIWGAGMAPWNYGGSNLCRLPGTTGSMLIPDPATLPGTEYWHWLQLRNLYLEDAVENMSGSGIEILARTGEGFIMENLFVYGFGEHNIAFRRGGTNLYATNLHLMRAKTGAGLLVERTAADTWNSVDVQRVSGDNNKVALIRVFKAGESFENYKFSTIKAESKDADSQPCVVELEGLNTAFVDIENVSAQAIGAAANPTSVVKLVGQDFARLRVRNARAHSKFTHMIENTVTPSLSVPNDGTIMDIGYRQLNGQGVQWKLGTSESFFKVKV
jgi:hypothetical protein